METENKKINNHCPNKIAHLAMIQGVIDRMGGNLFYLKGWSITLLAGLFAISTSGTLWIFDGYFLSLERCFRDLYDQVRKMDEEDIDFSMNIGEFTKLRNRSPLNTMFRPTLVGFYGAILISMVIIIKLI